MTEWRPQTAMQLIDLGFCSIQLLKGIILKREVYKCLNNKIKILTIAHQWHQEELTNQKRLIQCSSRDGGDARRSSTNALVPFLRWVSI